MKNFIPMLVIVALTAGCGGSSGDTEENKKIAKPESAAETPGNNANASTPQSVQIELSSNDEMKFDKNELTVTAGQTVTLTLKHIGTMDKSVMGHNFVLLKKGADVQSFAEKAMTAKDNDYIPTDKSSIIAHTRLIGGGESVSITFPAPEPGMYDYLCSFPGHYAMMKGKFIVK